jgi:tetratricopeptide (TPR) repeat protein
MQVSEGAFAEEFKKAQEALRSGNYPTALCCLQRCVAWCPTPECLSALGYCQAKVQGDFKGGVARCQEALNLEPDNSFHYLQLGRIHLLADRRSEAIMVWRQGLRLEKNRHIIRELERLGIRRDPVLTFLHRQHPVNVFLGKYMTRLGLR